MLMVKGLVGKVGLNQMTAESENPQELEKPSILSSSLKVGALCGKSRFSCFLVSKVLLLPATLSKFIP